MTSFSEGRAEESTNSENMLREIQAERIIYQINASSDARKALDKMKKDVEEITKAIENARSIAYEKKLASDELKITLSEKKEKIRKLQQELTHARKHVESSAKRVSNFETEMNKIKMSVEKIKEATQDLDSKYFEQAKNELMSSLVKITSQFEKAQSDLNAAREMETITSNKLRDMQIDFDKLESQTIEKTREIERITANVSTTIEHIIKSYEDMTDVSKDLLKSAVITKIGVEENKHESNQYQSHQEINESRIPI